MKKILILIGLFLASSLLVPAQCVEVKNVESQKKNTKEEKGFEFNNLNDYAVTVEAEIRTTAHSHSHPGVSYFTLDTKTFVVHAKEKYFWELDSYIRANGYVIRHTFVVFKAFKCQ